MNKFTVDYNKKTLALFFEGHTYNFDLTEGDEGDFWYMFDTVDGIEKDLNFTQEDETEIPCCSVYGTTKELNDNNEYLYSTNWNDHIPIETFEGIGDPLKYFSVPITVKQVIELENLDSTLSCPNCVEEKKVWTNSSGEIQCDNCGYSECE